VADRVAVADQIRFATEIGAFREKPSILTSVITQNRPLMIT
jgi:hypothetical protein